MKRSSLLLGLLCLATLSCTPKAGSDDPFADAKWIGTSERVLYADFLPQFILSADIDIADGSTRASVLLGGNDPRLMDADLNIMGVENGPDESFVRVELDRGKKSVNIYRTGFTKADVPGKVFQSLAVDDSLLTEGPARLEVEVTFNQVRVTLGGVSLGRVAVGPLGRSGDYIAYPQLADVGWLVEEGQTARVSNLEVREIRGPHALLYRNDGMTAAAADVKVLCEPSYGGMPVLRSSFKLKKKEIESATLYATARGIYEVCLNGEKVGADFLAPGLSQYN